jgi:hypothetical protein
MKKTNLLLMVLAGALGFACAYGLMRQPPKREQSSFAEQQAAWLAEKSELETALANARGHTITLPGATRIVEVTNKISPEEILERLKRMKVASNQPRSTRLLIHQFENLIEAGPAALPVIRDFLALNQDIDYDAGPSGKGGRGGKLPSEFNVPPSLRLGLFEALKNIGGADAEKILADALSVTGSGLEIAYLAQTLEEMSPGKYRHVALQAAHELLARSTDKSDRNFLFGTLAQYNDASFAPTAQAQLIQPDGKVDANALKYLQQTQPDKSLAIALQAYQDSRVTDAQAKEQLAQVALDSAGTDPLADQFFRAALADTALPSDNRRNLAEDFADHGTNPKNPSAKDFQIMQNRLAQLDQLRGEATDPLVIAGIAEAQKDLNKFITDYRAKHPQP